MAKQYHAAQWVMAQCSRVMLSMNRLHQHKYMHMHQHVCIHGLGPRASRLGCRCCWTLACETASAREGEGKGAALGRVHCVDHTFQLDHMVIVYGRWSQQCNYAVFVIKSAWTNAVGAREARMGLQRTLCCCIARYYMHPSWAFPGCDLTCHCV